MRGERFDEIPLGAVLEKIESGRSPLAATRPARPGEWGVLKVSAIRSGQFRPAENKALLAPVPEAEALEVRDGDLLITRANTLELVGMACVVSRSHPRLMLSDKTLRLTVDRELACPRFVEIVLATPRLRLQIEASATGTSGSMRNLSQEKLCNLLLPIPPMAEQRRIVAACASLDRVVERLERTAGKLRSVRDATISKMLARFSGSHVMVPVGERAEIQSGITLGPQRRAGGNSAAYLRVANVRMGWINGEDIAEIEELDTDRPRYEISDGDLLVVEGHADPGQIGRAALVSPVHAGMLYQNHLFRVRFESDLPIFAEAWLNSNASRTYWRQRCATSSGLYTINSRQLAGLPFPLVNMDEQYRLAALMEAGGRRIAAVEARIAKLRVLRRGLVGDLLAGRVRTEDL